ncbi:hypothetical protein WS72_25805 [Burkholderia savannae]|uniref:Uncharacterized protein n=2 Tax=Burkholderia savannae TaxID=1637837 RepID=A0ABR5T4Y4_9BURK|nr:hypothetical protein WS72_25805 [Burkholderia savannae]
MDLYDVLAISHKIGHPLLQLQMRLQNVGAREVKVSRIEVIVRRDGQVLETMSARNMIQSAGGTPLLFTPFKLQAKDEWVQIVNYFEQFSRENDRIYRVAEQALRTNIVSKIHQFNGPQMRPRLMEADPQFVTPFMTMFNAHFNWLPGQYEIEISMDTMPKAAVGRHRFRFILFESDTEALRELTDDYRVGAGIYFPNADRREWISPQLLKA